MRGLDVDVMFFHRNSAKRMTSLVKRLFSSTPADPKFPTSLNPVNHFPELLISSGTQQ
jgi:hypothetical protein